MSVQEEKKVLAIELESLKSKLGEVMDEVGILGLKGKPLVFKCIARLGWLSYTDGIKSYPLILASVSIFKLFYWVLIHLSPFQTLFHPNPFLPPNTR